MWLLLFPKLCSNNFQRNKLMDARNVLHSHFFQSFQLRFGIESRWRFHQAIHMLKAPRWPNEEVRRLLSSSSDSKWAEHKELSVKSWMSSTGPLPKTSGLSTPFKATFPITFTQTVQTKTTEMWGGATLFFSVANDYSSGLKVSHKIATTWAFPTSNDAACFDKAKAKKYEQRRTEIISCRDLRSGRWERPINTLKKNTTADNRK